jgi:ubiquinone/menaquinone biosynthesis C-methylase UbiE
MTINPADTFKGTGGWYARYRRGIEPEVRAAMLARVEHVPRPRGLLDLGTGTGQVLAGLAGEFDDLVGVDTEQDMLDHAHETLGEAGDRATLLLGKAEDVALPDGFTPHLITICRSFHWMDQPAVLARSSALLAGDGRLMVLGDRSFWTTQGEWKDIVRATIREFLGEQRRAGSGTYAHHDRPYDEVIAASDFSEVEEVVVPVSRTWDTDSALGYLYSTSFSSQRLYSDRLQEFDGLLRARLDAFQRNGRRLDETVDFTLFVGRIP